MKRVILLFTGIFFMVVSALGEGPYKPGDNASDFSLKNLKGETVSLSGLEDAKGFIVVFTCNTCPVVKQYDQRIKDLHKEFEDKGYPVIAINSNDKNVSPGDSYEDMKKTAKNEGYTFEYLYDENQDVARKFGATNTPHVYVLSKNGEKLKTEYVGAIDNNADDASKADKHYVKDAVNALLKGEQVAPDKTKAVGCGVKWKKA